MEPNESLPEVVPVEPPLVQAARPGPNVWMALLWWLGLLVTQQGVGVVGFMMVMIIAVILRGPEGAKPKGEGIAAILMLDVPGASLIYLFTGTVTTVVVSAIIVAAMNRRRAPRAMALRGTSV